MIEFSLHIFVHNIYAMSVNALSAELRQILREEKIPIQTLKQIEESIKQRGAAQMLAYLQVAAMRLQCNTAHADFSRAQDRRIHEILKLLHNCS
jgi:hypothetical protein